MEAIQTYSSSEYSSSPESMKKESDIHSSSLFTYLDNLLDTGLDSDFKIFCTMDGEIKEINVHKLILSRIPYFKTIFNNENFRENNENQITISDIEYDVIKEMIRYIYSTNVQKIRKLANKLLAAANKYGIDLLKTKCEHHLILTISRENAGSMLMLAHTHKASELEEATMKFIDINFPFDQRTNKTIPKCLIRTLNVDNATDALIFAYTNKWDDLNEAAMNYIQERFIEVKCSEGWIESFPKYLIDKISVENAAELFIFGQNTNIETLKEKASVFIHNHARAVEETDGYQKLNVKQLKEILSLSSPSKRRKLSSEE